MNVKTNIKRFVSIVITIIAGVFLAPSLIFFGSVTRY